MMVEGCAPGNIATIRRPPYSACRSGPCPKLFRAERARLFGRETRSRLTPLRQALQFARGDHRLDPVAHVQCAEDRRQVDLDRAFADAEVARDQLVRLALREQAHHVDLAFGQQAAQAVDRMGRIGLRRCGFARLPALRLRVRQQQRRDVDAAGQHQPDGGQHHVRRVRLGNEAEYAEVDQRTHQLDVLRAGQHDHRQRRRVCAQLGHVLVAVGAGHGDVDQDEVELVRVFGDRAVELVQVHRHHRFDAGIELGELDFHALDDQAVVVRDEHLHCGTFMLVPSDARRGERSSARMEFTIFRGACGHQVENAVPTA